MKKPFQFPLLEIMIVIGISLGAGIALTEEGRYQFISLQKRIQKKARFEASADTEAIMSTIAKGPGLRLTDLKRLSDSDTRDKISLRKLRLMEQEELVTSVRVGLTRRFFGTLPTDLLGSRTPSIDTQILNLIKLDPGIWEGKIAKELGLSQQIVHYHLKRLRSTGLLRIELDGKRIRYRLDKSA